MDIWNIMREFFIPVGQGRIRDCRTSGLRVSASYTLDKMKRFPRLSRRLSSDENLLYQGFHGFLDKIDKETILE